MLLLVDLDGTVWRGDAPVPGVPELLVERERQGDVVTYVTNNSMRHRRDYAARLERLGAPCDLARIVTSSRATAVHLATHEPWVKRVLAVGAPGMVEELQEVGLTVTRAADAAAALATGASPMEAAGEPDAVIVGLDRAFDYGRLNVASACVRAGVLFVATNRDPVFPTEHGLEPGAGSIVAAVEAAAGMAPIAIGKPGPILLRIAAEAAGVPLDGAVVIGDSILSDIPAARAAGVDSVLLMTGVTRQEHLDAAEDHQLPTIVAADADELRAALDRLAG